MWGQQEARDKAPLRTSRCRMTGGTPGGNTGGVTTRRGGRAPHTPKQTGGMRRSKQEAQHKRGTVVALFGVVVGNVVGRGAARGHRGRAGALGNAAAPHCAEVAGSGIPSGNPETAKADNAWAKRFLKAAETLDHPSEPGGYYCRGLQ